MATKRNPGKFDCYANAELDEPMFVLLARDELSPYLTKIWALLRRADKGDYLRALTLLQKGFAVGHAKGEMNKEKLDEAIACAEHMTDWLLNKTVNEMYKHEL